MTVAHSQKLVTALTCWLAALAAFSLHLQNPWWAAISAWIVGNADRTALVRKGVLRIYGTVIGCFLGYAAAIELEPSLVGQLLILFLIGFVANYFRSTSQYGYAWVIGSASALLLIASSMTSVGVSLENLAVYRGLEISCGVLTASLGDAALAMILRSRPSQSKSPAPATPLKPKPDLKIAAAAGLSAAIIPLLWLIFQLPEIAQSLVTAMVTLEGDKARSRTRGSQRIAGCLLGGALGLCFALTGLQSFLWWSAAFISGLMAMATLHLGTGRFTYVGTQGGVAFILVMVSENGPPASIWPVLSRLGGMILGVTITITILHLVDLAADSFARRARLA